MTVSQLLRQTNAFLFDLDGTLYLGNVPIEGAAKTLSSLRKLGKKVVFLTNNSSKTHSEYENKLTNMELFEKGDLVYTSAQATIDYLLKNHPDRKVYLVATEAVREEFCCAGVHLEENQPDLAVLAYDTQLTYSKIRKLDAFLRRGVPFFATHADDVCPTEESYQPDVGSFLALFQRASGRRPDRIFGKPNSDMALGVLSKLHFSADEVCMIGDRLYTDIRFANQNGLKSGLVLSGESSLSSLQEFPDKPDLILSSVRDLCP